jgi:hypothetical protein
MGPKTRNFSTIARHPIFASILRVSVLFNIRNAEWSIRHVVVIHQSWPWLNGVVLVDYSVTLVLGNCIVIVKKKSFVTRTVNHDR